MDFIKQLDRWVDEKNYDELIKCEFLVIKTLRQWNNVVNHMSQDPIFAKNPGAITVSQSLKQLKASVKRADALFKSYDKVKSQYRNNAC